MPKHTITFESEDKIPAEMKPFAKGLSVEVHFNSNDLALAGELNPTLDAHTKTVIEEKRKVEETNKTLKTEIDALKRVASDGQLDTAKIVVENETLKRQIPPPEDVQLLQSIKTAFPNVAQAEIGNQITSALEASNKVKEFEKRDLQKELYKYSGYKNETLFIDFISNPDNLKGIEGDIYAETIAGTTNKGLFVKVKDANGVPQPMAFNDFMKTNPKGEAYLPALMNGGGNDNQKWYDGGSNFNNEGDKATKPAWQTAVENSNKAPKINPFAPVSTVSPLAQQDQK